MSAYLSLIGRRRGVHLFKAGRLLKVEAKLRLGAYSNKYGMRFSLAFLLGNVQQADVFLIAIT